MIKESRYILKRILIGVGIVLVLSFIRGNKVKALTSLEMYNNQISPSIPSYCENKKKILTTSQFFINLQYPNFDISYNNPPNPSRSLVLFCFDTDITDFNFGSNLTNYVNSFSTRKVYQYKTHSWSEISSNYGPISNGLNFEITGTNTCPYSNEYGCLIWNNNSYGDYITSGTVMYSDFDKVRSNDIIYYDSSISAVPDFVSWHWTKITNNNIITGISLRPEFSIWNSTDYDYQYKIGKDSTTWLSLTENQQLFTFHNNGVMLYIRIKKRSDNSIILGANFTIANIGTYYNSPEYNINFSGEYKTENYLNNNVSKLQSVIKEYSIYVDYFPKNSITKYQYQYITSGTCSDVQTWQQVSSLDNGSFTYVASQNGTLCARILDSSDTVQYEDSYEVSTIGELAFDTGSSQVKGFFDKISSKINYGGPVGSLFRIPVETLSTLYSTMNNSNSCTPYSLPPIFGTTIQLGCYNFKNIVGNSVYNIIDAIFTFILCIGLFKMALKLYHNLISMKDIS